MLIERLHLSSSPPRNHFPHRRTHHIMKSTIVGKDAIETAVLHQRSQPDQLALEHGADLNILYRSALTALAPSHPSCGLGLFRLSLDHGTNPDAFGFLGNTASDTLLWIDNGRQAILRIYRERGCPERMGMDALHHTQQR